MLTVRSRVKLQAVRAELIKGPREAGLSPLPLFSSGAKEKSVIRSAIYLVTIRKSLSVYGNTQYGSVGMSFTSYTATHIKRKQAQDE